MLLQNCRFVITQNAKREILENVDILIEGNAIARIGKSLAGEPVLDCSDRIIMPGLVNAHMHLAMTHLRGVSDDKELHAWLADVWEHERHFEKKDLEQGASLGIVESLRCGTTTCVDMFFQTPIAARIAKQLGARYYGMESTLEGHPLSEKHVVLHESDSSRIHFGLGPHAITTASEQALREIAQIAKEGNALITIHLSETRKERAEFKATHGMLPAEYLAQIGLLGPNVLLVHCVWLTKGELDLIAKHGAKIVHCPQSNMKLAGGGVMPLREMRERNITIALGTDGAVSNNALDMFREMHVAALLHKHHYWRADALLAQDVLDMATIEGAKALGRDDLGSLEVGKLADLIALDCNDVNLLPCAKERIISHLVYAANGMNVSEVIIDGKLILQEKRFV